MPHAEHSVAINRPAADVFNYFADGEKCAEWRSGVIEIKRVSGNGIGAQYKQSIRGPGGRSIPADYTITEFTPNSRIAFQTTTGPVRPRGQYVLGESGGVTTLTFILDAELTGLKKILMGRMVSKTMATEVRAIEKAKAILEG